ncbi:MAG TPA: DMT family transporter [Thermosynechococcaceae cyanobacterium]
MSSLPSGELAALGAALIWAIASVLYSGMGRQLSPLILNLAKGAVAIGFLILTLGLQGQLFPEVSPTALGFLLLSGTIGIGIGDTAYFQALNDLGPRRALVLESMSPPLSTVLASVFLQEQLGLVAWLGIGLTVAGVLTVVLERTIEPSLAHAPLRGLGCGLLAALGQAVGAVLTRAALAGTPIDPLWSTLVRLLAGVLILAMAAGWQRSSPQALAPLRDRHFLVTLTVTAFASTYLAIWLQQISLKYTATGISQALSATSPLFVIPIALWQGEKVSWRGFLGVLVALSGVWLLIR